MTTEQQMWKAAVSAHLADQGIKLVHIWQVGSKVNAMLEWPYDPVARKPLTTEKHTTGVGDDPLSAVIKGVENLGFGGLRFKMFVAEYLVSMMAKEIVK